MTRSDAQVPGGAADTARRFSVSIKALRLYENLGLLRPGRSPAGWRTYGRTESERLHLILSLRQLGLSLARIGELARGDGHDLHAALVMQEAALVEQQRNAEQALALVRLAKTRIEAGATLGVEDLAALVRGARDSRLKWTADLERLARKVFTPAQRRKLNSLTAAQGAVAAAEWTDILHQVEALMEDHEPTSPGGLALGRRAAVQIGRVTGGDRNSWAALQQFWRGAYADPALSAGLPVDARQWSFLSSAIAALFRAGELPAPDT